MADGGGRTITLKIEGVFDGGVAGGKVRGWLAEIQRETDKTSTLSLQHAVANAQAVTKAEQTEAARQKKIADEILAYKIKTQQDYTKAGSADVRKYQQQELARAKADLKQLEAAEKASLTQRNKEARTAASNFLNLMKQTEGSSGGGFFSRLFGGGGSSATKLQQDFKGVASEASNLMGIFSGNRLTGATSQVTSFAGAVGAIPGVVGIAIGSLAGIGVAAAGAGTVLFELAKHAADNGAALWKFQQITGLTADSVSAFSYAAKLSGKDLDGLTMPMKMFTVLLSDARDGGDKAKESLKRLGIQTLGDTTKAFAEVAKHIYNTRDAQEKLKEATMAFGARAGAELIPIIERMGGNFDAFTQKAKALGMTLSQTDIDAAEEFHTTYDRVMLQATMAANRFAMAYGPQITEAMDDVGRYLARNQNQWASWGLRVGDVLQGVVDDLKNTFSFVEEHRTAFRVIADTWSFGATAALRETWGAIAPPKKHVDKLPGSATPGEIERFKASNYEPYVPPDDSKEKKASKAIKAAAPPAFGSMSNLVISTGNEQWNAWVKASAAKYGVDPNVLVSQMSKESSGHVGAVSPKGAMSLMQLMPGTARGLGVTNPFDPKQNIEGGAKYMGQLLSMFGGNYDLALAGYNAGPGAVQAAGGRVPRIAETQNYVKQVKARYAARVHGEGTGGGYGTIDPEQQTAEDSETATKAHRDEIVKAKFELWKKLGWTPGALLDDFTNLMVEDAKKGADLGLGAGVQPTKEEAAAIFKLNYGRPDTPIGKSTDTIGTSVTTRSLPLSDSETYIRNLRISLGLEKENADSQTRAFQLLVRKSAIEQEIEAKLQAQAQDRKEESFNLETEYKLLMQRNLAEDAGLQALQDRNKLTREIGDLEIELANRGMNAVEREQKARLELILQIKTAQDKLDDATTVHGDQVFAAMYGRLAQEKTATEATIGLVTGLYDEAGKRLDGLLDKAGIGKVPVLGDYVKSMARVGMTQMTRGLMDKLLPDGPLKDALQSTGNPVLDEALKHTTLLEKIAQNTGGLPAGYKSATAGGGPVDKVLSMLGIGGHGSGSGSGMGPGGTPNFNPKAGGGAGGGLPSILNPGAGGSGGGTSSGGGGSWLPKILKMLGLGGGSSAAGSGGDAGGGIFDAAGHGLPGLSGPGGSDSGGQQGGLGGIFGNLKGMFKPIKPLFGQESATAGYMSGIGSLMSMFGGLLPGRAGSAVSMAGTGMSLGAMFGGPIGGAIGAGIGALIGLFHTDNAIQKLKDAAASEFGISIKDKSVLNSLKAVGEGMFGRGKVGPNAIAVVKSDEGSNIIRAYAESSGQTTKALDRLNYADPNWSGNNFKTSFGGFRAMGGDIAVGYSYIMGEQGRELASFSKPGQAISNDVLMAAASGGGSSKEMAQTLQDLKQIMRAHLEVVDLLHGVVGGFKAVPYEHVVAQGLKANPSAAADAVESEFANDGKRASNFFRLTGSMV